MKKEYIAANDLVLDSFALAKKIGDSDWKPDVLMCLWRGGTPIGVVIHEYLLYKGIDTYHVPVKAGAYSGIGMKGEVTVEHMDSIIDGIVAGSQILLVDDIYDSGSTVAKVCDLLSQKTSNIKVATLYYKPGVSETGGSPDFYIHKSDNWIVFPHEIIGLSQSEIKEKGDSLFELLDG